ncbi:hypothetical protein JK628_07530 [Shewanella sp. KX20019]|uniref:hypothetical protein n=1 Tax=Shewanella sp. KX20019 TaxID=2803864 RepID=UPI001925A7AD|nr:hypothetical protein [Shewanella sp. KX20019]QQX81681.1 hypothetical protein JK628_07530 [Shewanella sp. KX20019]
MSKVFKLKKFFTLEEAANYLSSSLEEQVSLTDIYMFALEKQLTLSVRLLNQAYALNGQFITQPYIDNNGHPVAYDLVTNEALDEEYLISLDDFLEVEDNKWLAFNDKVHLIDGIWDLAMIGMETLDVEQLYQKEVGGPEPLVAPISGLFLKREGLICKLQNSLLPPPILENMVILEQEMESFLHPKGLTIDDFLNCDEVSECLSRAEIDSLGQLSDIMQVELTDDEKFEDSITLEDHSCQFVIRKNELTRFEKSLNEEDSSPIQTEESLGSKQRNTLLVLIGALCHALNIDPSARGVTPSVEAMTELIGVPLSDDYIRDTLADVEAAIERRQK